MLRTIYYALGIAVIAAILTHEILNRAKRSHPCDTCKNLIQKGGVWKYECHKPGHYFADRFNKPPEYCAAWQSRENGGDHDA